MIFLTLWLSAFEVVQSILALLDTSMALGATFVLIKIRLHFLLLYSKKNYVW